MRILLRLRATGLKFLRPQSLLLSRKICCLVAQAVSYSRVIAGVPSSYLGHTMQVPWWTKCGLCRVFWKFLPFPLPQISFHHFSIVSLLSFRFISLCLSTTGVVSRNPCYSLNFNIGASSPLVPRPSAVSDTS